MPHRVFRDYLEREVEIDWRVWHKKILRDHGEMVDEEEAVRRTLQNQIASIATRITPNEKFFIFWERYETAMHPFT